MSASQNSSQPTLLTRISGVLLGLLCLFFLGTFIVSVELAWEARQWSRPWPTGPVRKDTDEKAKRLEEKLSAYAKRAGDVHTLMGFILGLSALYGLALGVSSYLGVQHAVKQAEGSADDAEESAKEAKEVKSKADDALKDLNNALKDTREKAINEAREAVNEVRSQYLLQRPYYNPSIIEHGDAKYHEAETHLTRALDLSRWEVEALPKRKVNLYYNRACARCRLASAEPQLRSTHLDGAITDLEQVFQNRVLWSESEMRQTIAQDWQHGGDLGALRDSQTHAETFERLLSALRD
jgi:ElaB/YqjD/DUF883 family membrane-anchored ribosome-binding protein